MTDIASLGIRVTTQGVAKASEDLDKLSESGAKASKSTADLNKSFRQGGGIEKPARAASEAFRQQTAELAKLAAQIDPTVAKFEKLDEMQAKLARFRKSGAIGADDYKALNDRLEETRANVGKAGAAMHKFSLNTAASRRELGYITKDLAMGQWGRLSQSFSTLAVRSGALNLIMSPLGIAIGATAVSLAVLTKAAFDGEREIFDFNKALLATGGYAGKTALQLSDMADKVSEASGATLGASRDALEAVAASGRFTGKTFDLVVQAAAHMQEATGQSIGATIKKFEDIAKSPVDALLKLNETEHFLTESQLQRVQALQDEGREQDAASEASRIYASRLNDIASAADAATPHLSQMWNEAKKGASDAWEETKKFSEFLAAAAQSANKIPWSKRLGPFAAISAIKSLQSAEPTPAPSPITNVPGAIDTDKARAMLEFQREGLRYADKQERMEAEIAKAKADGLKAGADQIVIDERIARIRESYAEKLTKSPRHAASVSDPFSSLNGLVKQAQVFDQGVGNDSAQNQQAKAILAIVDAGAKLIASGHDVAKVQAEVAQGVAALNNGYAKQAQILQDQNTAALKAYQDAIDDQITARRNEIDLQVQSIGMGQQEAQQLMAVARIREQAASKIEQLNRQRAQKGADTQFIDAEINAVKDSIPVLVGLENDRWERTQAAQANGINGMNAAISDFVDQQKNQAAIMYQITSGFFDGFSDAFADFVSGTKSAKDAFGSLIDDMYRQALKFVANQAIAAIFKSFSTQGAGSGGGWGSLFANLIGAFGGSAGPGTIGAGLATGGIASPNSFHPVNENGPEIFTIHGRDYLSTGNSTVKVTPNGGGSRAVSVNQTIVVQGKINRRTSGQIAQDTARQQRIAAARNG